MEDVVRLTSNDEPTSHVREAKLPQDWLAISWHFVRAIGSGLLTGHFPFVLPEITSQLRWLLTF